MKTKKYLSSVFVAISFVLTLAPSTLGQSKSGGAALGLRVTQVGETTVKGSKDFEGKRFTAVLLDVEGRTSGAAMTFNATAVSVAASGKSVPAAVLFFVSGYDVLEALVVGPDEARSLGLEIRVGQQTFEAYGTRPLALQLVGSGVRYAFAKTGTVRMGFLFAVEPRAVEAISLFGRRLPISAAQGSAGTTFASAPQDRSAPPIRKYSDIKNKLSFTYPAAWYEMSPTEARQVMGASTSKWLTILIYDPKDRDQNVNVQVLPTAGQDLSAQAFADFAKEMDRRFPNEMPGFRKLSSRVGQLRGMAALEYVMELTRPDGIQLRQKQLRTGKHGREVVITFTAPAQTYDTADTKCFKLIADSLALD